MGIEKLRYPEGWDVLPPSEQVEKWKAATWKATEKLQQARRRLKTFEEQESRRQIIRRQVVRYSFFGGLLVLIFVLSYAATTAWGGSARTPNFAVSSNNLDDSGAARMAEWSEYHRKRLQQFWFGKEYDWRRPVPVSLGVYRQGSSSAGGQTSWGTDSNGEIVNCSISANGTASGMHDDVLAHETNHAVLAHEVKGRIPTWMHEGSSTYIESCQEHERQRKILDSLLESRQNIPFSRLMTSSPYEHPRALYSEGCFLTAYLVDLKGPQTFGNFMRESARGRQQEALQQYYDIPDYQTLEGRWLWWYRRDGRRCRNCINNIRIGGPGPISGGIPATEIPPPPTQNEPGNVPPSTPTGQPPVTQSPPTVASKHNHPELEEKIDALSKKGELAFSALNSRLDNWPQPTPIDLVPLQKEVDGLKVQFTSMQSDVSGLGKGMDGLRQSLQQWMQTTDASLKTLQGSVSSNYETFDSRLTVIEAKLTEPSGPPGFTPIQYKSGVSHYVLVGDSLSLDWPSVHNWAREARKIHPFLKIIYKGQIPENVLVDGYPQLIAYGLDGNEKTRDLGQFEVERALQRISRSEF